LAIVIKLCYINRLFVMIIIIWEICILIYLMMITNKQSSFDKVCLFIN
jgi:hypothetical protein